MYLYEPLRKTFSKAVLYDYLKRRAEIGIEAMNKEIIELVQKERPKYVLWTSFYYDVHQATLDTIRREGVTVIGWFFDDEWRFDDYSKWWVPHLDYVVTNAIGRVEDYYRLGANVIQTVPNTGIAIDRDWTQIKEKYDVSFVGSRFYGERGKWINELAKRNIKISLFGKGWGGYVSFEEMLDIFWHSKINLNFSHSGSYHNVPQIKGRVFQVCLAGGFMLTEYAPGIEKYFEIGKEIACFDNIEDMEKKIEYYLTHDEERRTIAYAGWKRAIKEHSSDAMVAEVFNKIEKGQIQSGLKTYQKTKLRTMPIWTRTLIPSHYHFHWGRALLEEGYPRHQWQGSLILSLKWSLLNLPSWFFLAMGNLPHGILTQLLRVYDVIAQIPGITLRKLCTLPYIGTRLRSLVKRFV